MQRRNDAFPKLEIVWIKTDQIDSASRQTRRALKGQIAKVKRAIERFGNRVPILVHRRTGLDRYQVIDGHARLAAARLLGAETIPCLVVDDLPDAEIRRLALSLNKIQETGAWDRDALHLEFAELIAIDADYDFPGFEIADVEALLLDDEDEGPDPADDLADHVVG
ncbi:MAG: ParB N-terminal domain-containing protein, partial [Paracoccaceae bacterium]